MSNIKISELPLSSTLGSTDLVPIVQSGGTKQTTAGAFFTQQSAFTQNGTGAVAEVPQTVLRYLCQSVKSYGAVGNGSTDDTAAIQRAIDAVQAAGGGTVFFPRGTYFISAALNLPSYTNVWLIGEGPNASAISTATNSITMINITGNSVRCSVIGLWIGSFTLRSGVTGIKILGTSTVVPCSEILIRNVTVQNVNSPYDFLFLNESHIFNCRGIQTIATAVSSVVMSLKTCVTVVLRDILFEAVTGTFGSNGMQVDKDCDTVIVENAVIVGGTVGHGFYCLNNGGTTGPRLSRFQNCYAEACGLNGFYVTSGRDIRFQGCHAAVNSGHGFHFNSGDSIVAENSIALQNNNHGFFVDGGTGIGFVNCTASNNSQSATTSYDGIRVENNVTKARVIGCRSGDFIFTLTNKQRFGLSIGATSTDYIVAVANILTDNTTGSLGNFSGGANNQISLNAT